MPYKIVAVRSRKQKERKESDYARHALELSHEYKLGDYFSLEKIKEIWSKYSEDSCANWLYPEKQTIEQAFGVILEDTEEEDY